jgi:hypothetical protein
MKFDSLYKRIFISEQDVNSEIADPAQFDDVEPVPLPELAAQEPAAEPAVASVPDSSTLTDYITKLEDFANKLNGTDGSSLQSLISKLDRVETPFEGISGRTSTEIVDAAKTLRSVSEKLKNFIIHASKR